MIPRKPVQILTKISWTSLLLWCNNSMTNRTIFLIMSKNKLGTKTEGNTKRSRWPEDRPDSCPVVSTCRPNWIRWGKSKLMIREMTHRKTRIIQIVMMLISMNKISRWEFLLQLNSITTSNSMVSPYINNRALPSNKKFHKTWATNKHYSPFKNSK